MLNIIRIGFRRCYTASSEFVDPLPGKVSVTMDPPLPSTSETTQSNRIIETFVFFDLETTGLLNCKGKGLSRENGHPPTESIAERVIGPTPNPPRITEMSFHAVRRSTFYRGVGQMKMQEPGSPLKCRIPTNVFTAQIDPEMCEEEWAKYENERRTKPDIFVHSQADLRLKNVFKTEYEALRIFLKNLKPPICLVAHNGVRFDFPIFFREVQRSLGNFPSGGVFPENTYLLDSYYALLHSEQASLSDIATISEKVNWSALSKVIEPKNNTDRHAGTDVVVTTDTAMRIQNGRCTVQREKTPPPSVELHPSTVIRQDNWSPAKRNLVKDPNVFKKVNNEWKVETKVRSYALREMYARIIKGDYNAHYASDDAVALMEICLAFGSDFVGYADSKAIKPPF